MNVIFLRARCGLARSGLTSTSAYRWTGAPPVGFLGIEGPPTFMTMTPLWSTTRKHTTTSVAEDTPLTTTDNTSAINEEKRYPIAAETQDSRPSDQQSQIQTIVPTAGKFSQNVPPELPLAGTESATPNEAKIEPKAFNPLRYRPQMPDPQRQASAANPAIFMQAFQGGVRPRASNPSSYKSAFTKIADKAYNRRTIGPSNSYLHDGHTMQPRHGSLFGAKSDRQKNPIQSRQPLVWSELPTLGQHLQAANEAVPFSSWIEIKGVSPVSTLDAMLTSINAALEAEQTRGMIDLDAKWSKGKLIPFLKPPLWDEATDKKYKWVRKAKVILSPYGRPKGW